ncbi:MAG: DUF58 domain-containing protein [Anaerolineae bacterium]
MLLGLIFALLLFGLAALNGSVIALAVPFAVYLGWSMLRRLERVCLTATRGLSLDRVSEGRAVDVTVTVKNEGESVVEARIDDPIAPGLELVAGTTSAIALLGPGESVMLRYTVRGQRGEHRFRDILVDVTDSAGLFHTELAVDARATLVVVPTAQRLRRIAIRPPRTRGFAGPIPARVGGSGIDFFGLREYQMGDRLRRINWRASARHQHELFTNDLEQERLADVGIIVDARDETNTRTPNGSLFEHSVAAAATLADTFLSEGNRVGMVIYGSAIVNVFPGYGRVQKMRILRALGRASTGHNEALRHLDRLPTRAFPAGSQIIFVSPLSRDDTPVLTRMRARGYTVMVVSPDPVSFEALWLKSIAPGSDLIFQQTAVRMLQVERRLILRQLRQVGVQVVNWDVNQPFDQVIRDALAQQPSHGHWRLTIGN